MRPTVASLLVALALTGTATAWSAQADQSTATETGKVGATANIGAKLQPAPTGQPTTSRAAQLNGSGYTEEEWFLQGQAQAYEPDGDWAKDGRWSVKHHGATQPYATRLLVRRPQDPSKFNGIVVVEWLNTTMAFDLDGGWILQHEEMMREGYAWVGVSAEPAGIKALKASQPARYPGMQIDSLDLAFDIYTQAAQAIRQQAAKWAVANAKPSSIKLLGLGYSQSGVFLTTYLNAIQPIARAYDGFYIRGTAPAAAPLLESGSHVFAPHIRSDLNVPVMQVQTEMEVMVSWTLSSTQDTDKVRYWEIPGAAHFDHYLQEQTLAVATDAFRAETPVCWKPGNTLPARDIDHAALHGLRQWVSAGTLPPKAPRLQRGAIGFVSSDSLGNALGGVRLPELDAPLAQYGMYSNLPKNLLSARTRYACVAGGSTNPLSEDAVHARYKSRQDYIEAYQRTADKLLADGFLRPADHAALLEQAQRARWAIGD